MANITTPVVAANVDLQFEPELVPYIKPSIILDYNGTKIGVIGYITPDTEWLASPGNIIFQNEERHITKQVRNLYKEGVKIIVALGHSGYERDKEIAARVPLIDVVVGGHSHTYLHAGDRDPIDIPEGPYPTVIKQVTGRTVLVVQAYAFAKYVGKLLLTFENDGELKNWSGEPILIEPGIPDDPDIAEEISKWLPTIQKETKEVISKSNVLLEGASEICRRRECSIGNLYTSSMLKKVSIPSKDSWTQIPAALLNAGATRVSLQPGDLSVSDLLQVHPFGNEVAVVTTKGDHLRRIVEHAVDSLDYNSKSEDPGAFLQMTGMRVKYDMCAVPGSRVIMLEILCQKCLVPVYEDVENDKIYSVVTGDYMARDGDGFDIVTDAISITHPGYGLNDMVRDYLTQISPVIIGNDGRIFFIRDGTDCSRI